MRRIFKISIILFWVTLGGLLTLVGLYRYTDVVDNTLLRVINHFSGEQVQIRVGNISGNLLGTVRLDDVWVVASGDTLSSARVEVDYSLLDMIQGRYLVRRLLLQNPEATLHIPADTLARPDTAGVDIDGLIDQFSPERLPTVRIGWLEIANGRLVLKSDTVQEFSHIQLGLSGALSPGKIQLDVKHLRGIWDAGRFSLDDVQLQIRGNLQHLEIPVLHVAFRQSAIQSHGEIQLQPDFRFQYHIDSLYLSVSDLQPLQLKLPYQRGEVRGGASVGGNLNQMEGHLRLGGQLDQIEIHQAAAAFQWSRGDFSLRDFILRGNFGLLGGQGDWSAAGDYRAEATFSGIDLQKLALSEEPTRLNGRVQLALRGTSPETVTGAGNIILTRFSLGPAKIDSVMLRLQTRDGNIQILPRSRITVAPGSRFLVEGTISRDQTVGIRLLTENNQLGALAARLGWESVSGLGSMELELTGPLTDPSLNSSLFIDSLRVEETVIYGIEGSANITNILGNRQGNLKLELATGYIGDIFLTSGQVELHFNQDRITLNPFRFYSEENSVEVVGYLDVGDTSLTMTLSQMELRYQNYQIYNQDLIQVRLLNNEAIHLDRFALQSADSGLIRAEGQVFLNGGISDLTVRLNNIRLEPFNQYLYWKHQMTGFVEGEMNLYGKLENPEIDLMVFMNDLAIDTVFLGKAVGDFTVAERRLSINVLSFEGPDNFYFDINGSVDISLTGGGEETAFEIDPDIPLGLNVVFGNLKLQNYDFLYQTTYPIRGQLTGRLDVSGSWKKPRGELTLSGEALQFADYDFPEIQLKALLKPDQFVLEDARINFLNTVIRARGLKSLHWDPARPDSIFADKYFELYAEIEEDSINFLSALNPQLERLVGKIQLKAALQGDYDNPEITRLDATVMEGKLYLSRIENSIESVNAAMHLEGRRLILDQLVARAPRQPQSRNFVQRWFHSLKSLFFKEKETGEIAATGWVDLSELTRPKINIRAKFKKAYFNYFLENTRVIVTSNNLQVTGRDTLLVSGDIRVEEGDVEFDFVESEKNLLFETSVRDEPPFVTYNLNVEILPNFHIRSYETLNSFEMNLSGELRIIQEPRGELEMYGSLETSGKYFIQGEDFQIQSGKINFVNPKDLPELNLTAQTIKRDQTSNGILTFVLKVHGKIDAPTKELMVLDAQGNTLQYDVKDQLALLLFGVRFDQLSGSDAQDLLLNRGEQVLTQALISTIEREARSFTGLDEIRVESDYNFFQNRLNRQQTLALGKYLTPNLYLEYRSRLASSGLGSVPAPQLTWEAGNQIYLQYRLNRNWSFSSFYQKTLEGNNKVQFDINWQISF